MATIKKSELKNLIMPIVKECVEEIVNQRIMASIVKEVAAGVVQGMSVLTEERQQPIRRAAPRQEAPVEMRAKQNLQSVREGRERLIESLGGRNSIYGEEIFADVDVTEEEMEQDTILEQISEMPEGALNSVGGGDRVQMLAQEGVNLEAINFLMKRRN